MASRRLRIKRASHPHQSQISILYPTTNPLAKEARIDVTDPMYGKQLGQVCLRPVNLTQIEELVSSNTAVARRQRETMARRLAFGAES